jgi:broad specificity phosphatase PhoE
VRHAPVDAGGRIYGQGDLDCDVGERAVFESLARRLPEEAHWVTSHLRRTRQTAEAILGARPPGAARPALQSEAELAEQHFGEWQGLSHAELAARRDGAWHRFWLAPAHEAPPGGESFADLVLRTRRAILRLSETHAGGDIVAVAHGGTIRAALALALDLPPERALGFVIDNCSLTRLDLIHGPAGSHAEEAAETPGVWRVVAVNLR